jgi:hypothetical protein
MVGYRLGQTLSDHGTVSRGICRLDASGFLDAIEEVTGLERAADGALAKRMDGSVRSFQANRIVSMNCWGFRPVIFKELDRLLPAFLKANAGNKTVEYYLPTVVNDLVLKGAARVHVLQTEARWFGVTYREDAPGVVHAVAQMTASGQYPAPLLRK